MTLALVRDNRKFVLRTFIAINKKSMDFYPHFIVHHTTFQK